MDTAKLLASVPTGLWIGGEERAGTSTFDVLNPATDEVITAVAEAPPADGIAALDAASAVEPDWAATPARERGEILRSVFETITAHTEDIATLMTLEMGKVLAESRGEVKYGAELLGQARAELRLPLVQCTDATKKQVREAMVHAGLIN